MSFEGGNASPQQERKSLSAEWLKFNIDPAIPLTLRTWLENPAVSAADPAAWPQYIKDAAEQHLGVLPNAIPSHEMRGHLATLLAAHDAEYVEARATMSDVEIEKVEQEAQNVLDQEQDASAIAPHLEEILSEENSAVEGSELEKLRKDLEDLRMALESKSLGSKKEAKVKAAVAWHEAQIARLEQDGTENGEVMPQAEVSQTAEVVSAVLPEEAHVQDRAAALRAEISDIESKYRGNNDVAAAKQLGIEASNREDAGRAIEKMVAEREAEVKRLGSTKESGKPEPQEQVENKRGEISPEAAQLFEKTFNIKSADLASIEGFNYLSAQQQKFVLENLSQLTLGNVREEASRTVSEAVGMRKSEMTQNYGKFLGGVLAGAREAFTSGYTKLKTEKAVVARMEKGGMAQHGALLQELVSNIAKYGPRVNERAGGELVVDLVNIRDRASDQRIREAEFFAIGELNAAAYEFTKTPAEWKGKALGTEEWKITSFFKEKVLRTSGKVQESAYEKRAAAYEQKKRQLEEVLKQKGYDDLKIAETLIGLDSRVHQLQTLRTSPDAMAELANIKDKSFFAESAKQFFKGPGAYMALGAVGRTLGGAALGFFGAPVASATIASFRSWNRSAAELRERDRNARAGVIDNKKGALNVVAAEHAEQTVLVNGKEVQNGLTAKLLRLTERARSAEGDEKKRLLAQLRTRTEYVHDKQKLQRVNYGKPEGRVSRQVALTEALAQALTYLASEDMAADAESTMRYGRTMDKLFGKEVQDKKGKKIRKGGKLSRIEEEILKARKRGRYSDLATSATTAAGFSVAGALIADYFRDDSVFFNRETDPDPRAAAAGAKEGVIGTEKDVEEFVKTLDVEKTDTANAALDGVTEYSNPTFSSDQTAVGSAVESVVGKEALAPYTIQRGDTLIGIMREKIPAIRLMGEETTMARENATMNILRDLTAKELQDIGITSGNVNKIYAGDSINMEKLNEAILARKGMIERAIERFGDAPIGEGAPESIPTATVTEAAPSPLAEPKMPLFRGEFDGELMTQETAAETFPIADTAEDTEVEPLAETVKTEPPSTPEEWTKPEAVATRAKDLQTLFTESLRANDRTAWARWAQGWQSPFSNKSELFLESARQHLISQRGQFIELLKEYKIPFAPQGGESQPESVARFSRLLAEKITPEDLQRLNVS